MHRHSLSLAAQARLASATLLSIGLCGCAGGGPLLHPAKTLGKGEIRAALGLSGEAATGNFGSALQSARAEAGTQASTLPDKTYSKGALVAAAVNPGLAPFVAARVGLGDDFEGGLAYTGRAIRIDFRRAFYFGEEKAWAFSVGAGGMAALYGRLEGGDLPGVNLSDLKGWGADLPLLLGYEATSGLYMVWFGARGGWEHDTIAALTSEPGPGLVTPPTGLSVDRYWGGAVVGAATGFRHLHVALEIDAAYESLTGSFGGTSASVSGVTLVPAAALWWQF
jgi:hypothetical protein